MDEMSDCLNAIYSEEYMNFLVKYDGDIERVNTLLRPDCVNIVNSRFLVAYSRADTITRDSLSGFGYGITPKGYGLLDTSVVSTIQADRVRALPGLMLTGEGVLIGFVDTGIDYRNTLFRNIDGSTKIAAIWDQNEEVYGTGNPVFGYGAEYTASDIDRALTSDEPYNIVPSKDNEGHGTFMASVAAARDYPEEPYIGVAPNSQIIMVKLKQIKDNLREFYFIPDDTICYGEDDIVLGIRYLIDKAVELKKPLVICLGIGTNQGDHAGNTYLEQYLSSQANLRGICIVSAGGNELGYGGHYMEYNRMADKRFQEDMEISVGEGERGFTMEIWGSAPELYRISVLSPTGERLEQIPYNRDGSAVLRFLYEGTTVYVENVVVESISGDQLILLRFDNPAPGIWTIQVNGTIGVYGSSFNAWLPMHNFLSSDTSFVRPNPDITLCSPGNGRGSITVAGYNHYTRALYVNSSRGYTRLGAIKPDITAPAVNVYGAFATGGERALFTRRSGTSVASAVTAGAAALILEWGLVKGNSPYINTEQIRQLMIRGVQRVSDTEYPNRAWGYGALDIYGAFEALRNI